MSKNFITCFFIIAISIYSCKPTSKASHNSFSNIPTQSSTLIKITTHYNKDALKGLLSNQLSKTHFDIATINDNIISTNPKQRNNIYYKYRIEVSDGQAIISGKYQIVTAAHPNPFSSESFWTIIYFGGGGIINARGFEDVKIMSDAIDDAVLSYNK